MNRSKTYSEILSDAIKVGQEEFERPSLKLFLSAISAGLDLGFSALLICAFLAYTGNSISPLTQIIGVNLLYSVGFIFVVVGRSELFTEHTTLSILPVLDGKASLKELARVWGTIFLGNMLGALIFSYFASVFGPIHGLVNSEVTSHVYHNLLDHPNYLKFLSAVLAGWLMGLLTWLAHASKETVGDILVVVIITFSIGFLGLHHSIAGSIEVLMSMFSSNSLNLAEFFNFLFWVVLFNFLFWVVLGNTAGGVIFVGLLKYSHAKRSGH
jgi:formate/nitrite transporter FocA (FNT family)